MVSSIDDVFNAINQDPVLGDPYFFHTPAADPAEKISAIAGATRNLEQINAFAGSGYPISASGVALIFTNLARMPNPTAETNPAVSGSDAFSDFLSQLDRFAHTVKEKSKSLGPRLIV